MIEIGNFKKIKCLKNVLKEFLLENNAQSEWSSIYMLVIVAIAAIVIIALIKPMFQNSQQVVQQNPIVQQQAQSSGN